MEQSKSALKWFNKLPVEICNKAAINAKKKGALSVMSVSLKDALSSSFLWDETPEGHDFWEKIHRDIEN